MARTRISGLFAVFVGLTCDYLPFLALPLYASVEKIDWSLAEAWMFRELSQAVTSDE